MSNSTGNIVVSISETDGTYRCLYYRDTLLFLAPHSTIIRASQVEPVNPIFRSIFHSLRSRFGEYGRVADFTRRWPCLWRINLAPSGGPILPGTWRDRRLAIATEIDWLNQNFL